MPRDRVADRVVVVAIDERALAAFGQWPWPRTRVADLVARLQSGRPLALALDMFFPEPDRYAPAVLAAQVGGVAPALEPALRALPSPDATLGRALAAGPSILAVAGLDRDEPAYRGAPGGPPFRFTGGTEVGLRRFAGHLRSVAEVDAGAASHGLASADFEGGVARRVPFVALVGGHGVLGLGVELVRAAVGGPVEVRSAANGLVELRFGDYAVPAQPDGRAFVRFGRSDNARFVPAADVLEGRFDTRQLEGKLVLVGFTGLGLQDLAVTPLGESVHGVENHAQVAEAVLEERFLRRLPAAPVMEAAFLAAFGLLLVAVAPRASATRSLLVLLAGIALATGAGAAAFAREGLLVDAALPSLGAVLVFVAVQAGSLAEAQRQRQALREQAARLAGEMHAAQRIQLGLLPDPGTVFRDERRVEVAAILEPARSVGGDFYDCFMLDARRLFLVVADVSGKGLPASLFMASAKSILRNAAQLADGRVGETLARAQAEIRLENPEALFVTAFAAVLDADTGEVAFANAGHEPVWLRARGTAPERLAGAGGPPLAVLDEFDFPTQARALGRGDSLLLLSDGVTEATDAAGGFFGADRLRAVLAGLGRDASARDAAAAIRDAVHAFAGGTEPADDLTLLVVRWIGPG